MPCGKSGGEGNGNPPGKTGVNEDYVSLSTLWELLDPQKLFYKDMLDLHEKNFKTFLTVIMEKTNKQIHDLVKDVLDFKHSVEFSQSEMKELKSVHTVNLNAFKSISSYVYMLTFLQSDLNLG